MPNNIVGEFVNGLTQTKTHVSHGILVRYYDPDSEPPRMLRAELRLPTGGVLEQRWIAWGRDRDWPTPEQAMADRHPPEVNERYWNKISTRFVTPWENIGSSNAFDAY